MIFKLNLPIVIERVKVEGPSASREVDLILDSGARFVSLSWEVFEDIGYAPVIVSERVKIVTANGVIEVPLLKVKKISMSLVSDLAFDILTKRWTRPTAVTYLPGGRY